MKVYVSEDGPGFTGTVNEFNKNVVDKLLRMIPPKTNMPNTEYAVKIGGGSACIFRVNIGMRPRIIEGSMLAQIERGSLKIGFVDIHDENITDSICKVIQEHWRIVSEDANAELSVVYSPLDDKVAQFQ